MKAKYINPFTDFGFKKLFGEEASKPMLIDFLNSLLPESNIVELAFKDKEQLGNTDQDRKAIYDIYCENEKGGKFIVELQKANGSTHRQKYFKDRTIYYSTFPIREQAEKGEWNYQLKAVYCIGVLDFTFDDYDNEPERKEVIHTVQLKDQHNKLFFDKLKYVYLEMPNFKKTEQELQTRLDEWLYFIKNLEDFQSIPAIFEDEIFMQAFEKAEIAKYSEREFNEYQQSLKYFRDNNATFDYAVETAFDEGKMERSIEIAKTLKEKGFPNDIISSVTGLLETEIENL